jgi:hypothetical protein
VPVANLEEIWNPKSVEEIESVKVETDRIVETKRFRNSRRFPKLLRYLVDETLRGRGELLKERSIGMYVLGCPADYDTTENPIVRVTVAEIRKRLAQYYQDEGRNARIRIDLQPGRYMPHFLLPRQQEERAKVHPEANGHEQNETFHPSANAEVVSVFRRYKVSRVLIATAVLLAGLMLGLDGHALWSWTQPSAINEFWKPLLTDRRAAILCLPDGNNIGAQTAEDAGIVVAEPGTASFGVTPSHDAFASNPRSAPFQIYETLHEHIVFSDAAAALDVSNYLASHRRKSHLRLATATALEDLRSGPVILIGGIDNPWTLHAVEQLPYRFAGNAKEQYWIVDRNNPNQRKWVLDTKQPVSAIKHDYAIVARIFDQSTGQIEVIVAGIGMSGTEVAGQFVVDERQMDELRRRIGPAFRDNNVEAILSTDVVNGSVGSPRIEAASVW